MVPLRASSRVGRVGRVGSVARVALVATGVMLAAPSCRCSQPDGQAGGDEAGLDGASAPPGNELDPRFEGSGDGAFVDASHRFVEAGPKVEVDPDGPVEPACSGPEVSFAAAVVEPRCAIGSARAKVLRAALEQDGGKALTLRQEATVEGEGRLTVRLVNTGHASLTLPLSWSAKLPSFTVLAEDERHSIYELAPARFEPAGGGGAAGERAHFARIVLPPGGKAAATVTVDPTIAKVLRSATEAGAEACPDGASCAGSKLPRGRYVLHVGELLTDVEAGPPARVTWTLP